MLKLTVKFSDIGADNGFGDNEISIKNKLRQFLDYQFPEWDNGVKWDTLKIDWDKMRVSVKLKQLYFVPAYDNKINNPAMFQV